MALGVIGNCLVKKGMKIHQGAITHEICCLAAQSSLACSAPTAQVQCGVDSQ